MYDVTRSGDANVWTTVDRATVPGLLRSGWNPRSEEGTIFLRWAVERNYEDSVAALLEAGADPNADRSPIIQMAQRASIVRFLLRAGECLEKALYLLRSLTLARERNDRRSFQPPLDIVSECPEDGLDISPAECVV